jgi:hypothetical protein
MNYFKYPHLGQIPLGQHIWEILFLKNTPFDTYNLNNLKYSPWTDTYWLPLIENTYLDKKVPSIGRVGNDFVYFFLIAFF